VEELVENQAPQNLRVPHPSALFAEGGESDLATSQGAERPKFGSSDERSLPA